MGNIQPGDLHTRRTALTLLSFAVPALSQSRNNPVVHFEIGCRDRAKTARFFTDLFGWQIQEGPAGTIDTGASLGIQGHITALGHEPQHYTIFYVEVDNAQAYLDKAVSLGGKVVVPPVKIPTGIFAWMSDPEGNTIGLLQSAK
jgi:predicted enzyme related to lactoylglutathione lyase